MNINRESPNQLYGAWKFIYEIELSDMLRNPIWAWCMQVDDTGIPDNGDETSLRPIINCKNVTSDTMVMPLILLKIQGSDDYACGLYNHEDKKLQSISIFTKQKKVLAPCEVTDLKEPVTYMAIPSIDGESKCLFRSLSSISDEATRAVGCAE